MALVCVKDFENYASNSLSRNALDYYRSGAGAQTTLVNNKAAYTRLRIRPRVLRNVSKRDLSTTIFGRKISMPIGIAATGMQKMAHADGECATARAAESLDTIFALSTVGNSSIEEVAAAAPNALKWFQLYVYKDRNLTQQLIERAESAGFVAIVVTVDAPVFGIRLADMRNKFHLPRHLRLANFDDEKADLQDTKEGESGLNQYTDKLFNNSLEWTDIKWLQSITKLPIVIKGILTAEDALIAADLGVSAIQVSNHGARQLDGAPATIEVLPEIVRAVGNRIPIFIDGGITDGTDVFKALALGADMVFVGRPALWGLSYNGENGVKAVFDILRREFDTAMALAGCRTIKDIVPEMVVHELYYSKL